MDPLTHSLLGAAGGYLCYHRTLGRSAAVVGAVAALLPDADVFIRSATDPLLALEMHRGFTHSLLFAPFGAALAALPWWLRSAGKRSRGMLWACATTAYVSHCLLDAATSYGTRLFWPFSNVRVGWDFVSVIDPVVTLTLLVGVAWAVFRRTPRAAGIAFALVIAYLGAGAVQRARVASVQKAIAASRGHVIERSEIMPTLGNLTVWRSLYLREGEIHGDRLRVGLNGAPTYVAGWSLPEVTESDLTPAERLAAEEHDSFRRFRHFSGNWVGRSPGDPAVLADMRYSLSTAAFDPIWGIRLRTDRDGPAIVWVNRSRDRQVDVREMWAEIVGKDPRHQPAPTTKAPRD